MFDNGSTGGVGAVVDDDRPVVDPLVLPGMLFATAQSENMLAAQKVLGASMLSESRFNAELDVSGDVDKAWRIACNEIAVMLTCSRRTAEVHIEIGDALREFLPLTKAAFSAGELDYARVRKIVDGLTGVDPRRSQHSSAGYLPRRTVFRPGNWSATLNVSSLPTIRTLPPNVAGKCWNTAMFARVPTVTAWPSCRQRSAPTKPSRRSA